MPLKKGRKYIGENIEELEKTGRPYKQALAIALKTAGVKKKTMKIPKKWIDIEMEHTKSRTKARKIVMDHLKEFKGYYPALIKMEAMLKKKERK